MKRNENFLLSEIADNHVLVSVGPMTANFSGIITLNDMGVKIWELLEKETTTEEIAEKICNEYEIDKAGVRADLETFLQTLREAGCLEE